MKKKVKIKTRNYIALAAIRHNGGGKHHNRDRDVSKGRSRKSKHKKRLTE